jgi:hypothetical protein
MKSLISCLFRLAWLKRDIFSNINSMEIRHEEGHPDVLDFLLLKWWNQGGGVVYLSELECVGEN